MRKEPNKKMIGLFIIIGFLILIGIIVKFTLSQLITRSDELVVMYFDESIKGLSVGSPVVFKGVEIGKVAKIELLTTIANMDFNIPVYARMLPNQNISPDSLSHYRRQATLDEFIKKGLRARLSTQSYLTGQLMVELEILPNTPIVLKHDPDLDILEIPTVLSPFGELSKDVRTLPFRAILDRLNAILGQLEKQLPLILPPFESFATQLDKLITRIGPDMTDMVTRLNGTLYDVSDAAKALRNMADYLERHPEALLKGKKDY